MKKLNVMHQNNYIQNFYKMRTTQVIFYTAIIHGSSAE